MNTLENIHCFERHSLIKVSIKLICTIFFKILVQFYTKAICFENSFECYPNTKSTDNIMFIIKINAMKYMITMVFKLALSLEHNEKFKNMQNQNIVLKFVTKC